MTARRIIERLGQLIDVDLTGATDQDTLTYDQGSDTWVPAPIGAVTDHGALTGLGDDDHPQYHDNARGDARYHQLSTDLATQVELDAHINDATDAHDASAISILDAAADFTATDVEGALAELQSDHEADEAALAAHLADGVDAHDASAISFVPAGTIAATDVQAAIEEVAAEAGGGLGAPANADYLVGTANLLLSNEIVVGTSPGGELGGTWASPTVDATHSGSSHADVQAAAEATAAAELAAHTGDTTDAHDASAISNVAAGGIAATDVQAAINELDTEKAPASHAHAGEDITSGTVADARIAATIARDSEVTAGDATVQGNLDAHVADAVDAHDASAISSVAAGGLASTDVQSALDELDTEKTTAAAALAAAQTEIADQRRVIQILVTDPNGDAITTGDGKAYADIPQLLGGHNLVHVSARLTTVSSSGVPTVQVHNVTQAADMLSTRITIDANELHSKDAVAPPVIDAANDDVAYGDLVRIDIDVAGTGAKGLIVCLAFEAP